MQQEEIFLDQTKAPRSILEGYIALRIDSYLTPHFAPLLGLTLKSYALSPPKLLSLFQEYLLILKDYLLKLHWIGRWGDGYFFIVIFMPRTCSSFC